MARRLCFVLYLILRLLTLSAAIPLLNNTRALNTLEFDMISTSKNASLHRRQMPLQPGASPPTTGCVFNNVRNEWVCDYSFPSAAVFKWWMSPLNGGGVYLNNVPFFWSRFADDEAKAALSWGEYWLKQNGISFYWWGNATNQNW